MANTVVQLLRDRIVLHDLGGAHAVNRGRDAALGGIGVRVADNLQFLRLEEVRAVRDLDKTRTGAVTSKVLHCGCIL